MDSSFSELRYSLAFATPEFFLAVSTMILLVAGAFGGAKKALTFHWLSIVVIVCAGILVSMMPSYQAFIFNGQVAGDPFGYTFKILCLGGGALAILMSMNYMQMQKSLHFEYPLLILFSLLGMMVMISANDLITLYVGLEMQSLALYVLASIRRDSTASTEAGLKYFVLGALSSGFLLYGASLIYGLTGSTNFEGIAMALGADIPLGLLVGLMFVLAALCFKISAAPFHMWTPDVYEGAPTPVTAFFAIAPKAAAVALLIRLLLGPFIELFHQWQQVIILISLISMAVGAFGAIAQTNIKRLLAYSSIGHVGYMLVGLASGTQEGIEGIILYLTIYIIMNAGAFAIVIMMRRNEKPVESIQDLAGFSRTHPVPAFLMAVFMFSMAGIPPLAGFFAKLYVFLAAVHAGLFGLAVAGVILSVISAYYYIRIIKIMYFDAPGAELDHARPYELSAVMLGSGFVILFFILFPDPLLAFAHTAAVSFFGL